MKAQSKPAIPANDKAAQAATAPSAPLVTMRVGKDVFKFCLSANLLDVFPGLPPALWPLAYKALKAAFQNICHRSAGWKAWVAEGVKEGDVEVTAATLVPVLLAWKPRDETGPSKAAIARAKSYIKDKIDTGLETWDSTAILIAGKYAEHDWTLPSKDEQGLAEHFEFVMSLTEV